MQLSCHDNGWDGTPLDSNPYAAQGSRFVFGYSVLLAPAVPIFMAREEFNAEYVPLPAHTPGLFGQGEPGTGRWLYASWLQWDQLHDPARAAMLDDVKRIIRLRRRHAGLIFPLRVGHNEQMPQTVAYRASATLPTPYLYVGADQALLVAGNPHLTQDVEIQLAVTAGQLGLAVEQPVQVIDLWNEAPVRTLQEFAQHKFTIKRDKAARGGLLILSIRGE